MKLLYITNIPAPYRQKRFNTMAEIFPTYGINIEVLYMAKIEPNRKWKIPDDSYNYEHKIYKGIHPVIGGFFAHFNPGLLFRLLKNDYDIAIIGGMASPTHWLAPYFISKNKLKIMSIESNLFSTERKSGFGAKLKSKLLNKANAYQVTGTPQIEYINFFTDKASDKKFIKLPNLIDEEVFRDEVATLKAGKQELRKSFGVNDETQMWVLPARLIEIKGIIPFLKLLKGVNTIHLFILGDGEQRMEIETLISKQNLPVTLTGFIQQETVIKYYAAADLFVLPSLKDPSPLSPIEACAAELPLLVSSRIGNLEDVLGAENGWSYDPEGNEYENKNLIRHIAALNRADLSQRAHASSQRYSTLFDSEMCLKSYVESIIKLLEDEI